MAQKKTTSRSGGGTKKSSSGRGSSAKKTSSSRSGGAAKKPASRSASTASRSGSRGASAGRRTQPQPRQPIRRQVGCVVLLFLGIISAIGYFPVEGWLVSALRRLWYGMTGWGFYLVPVCLLWGSLILGFHRGRPVAARLTCVLLMPVVFGAFIHALLFAREGLFAAGLGNAVNTLWTLGQDASEHCGGVLAGSIGTLLRTSVGVIGSFLLLTAAFILLIVEGASISVVELLARYKARPRLSYELQPEEEPDESDIITDEDYFFPLGGGDPIPRTDTPGPAIPREKKPAAKKPATQTKKPARPSFYDQSREEAKDELFAQFDVDPEAMARVTAALDAKSAARTKKPASAKKAEDKPAPAPVRETRPSPTVEAEPMDIDEAAAIAGVELHSADMDQGAAAPVKKEKIDADAEAAAVASQIQAEEAEDKPAYVFPPEALLNRSGDEEYGADGQDEMAEQLEGAIRSFGVGASITGSVHGPTITRYELKLEQGVKLNKITNLAGDIALSLGVTSVRIAPIPDKISTVGVEVPNRQTKTVWLGDLIDSDTFRSAKNKLSVALGKDIGGKIIVGNIAKMPHVLIAGTTGSGKSVCINSLILSLLYKSTPDEVRMIMIDPKMVELGIYNGMPHLYVPVVTDPKKAAGALQWSVVEMLKRYRLFSDAGVRDLAGYNAAQRAMDEPTLPQVVIIIDELADLMMVASKEVEEAICRVAQMGRAAGMHLVVATQRPSADVITGLMKANIPSRIAFAVSSALESRIILDQQGAEKLVGAGDMLYSPIGSKPIRVQGAFVTDEEREEIINFVKKEAEAEYSDEILAQIEKAAEEKDQKAASAEEESAGKSDYDELLPQAVDVIFETKQASVSMLQRRLKLGYSRAARLIDQLEEVGVVGPYEGSKPRQIVITKQQWQEMQYAHGTAPVDTIAQEFAQVSDSEQFVSEADEPEEDMPPADALSLADGEDELL